MEHPPPAPQPAVRISGTELFNALATQESKQPLLNDDLLNVDYREVQKKAWQQQQEESLYERLSRRVVIGETAQPKRTSNQRQVLPHHFLLSEVKPIEDRSSAQDQRGLRPHARASGVVKFTHASDGAQAVPAVDIDAPAGAHQPDAAAAGPGQDLALVPAGQEPPQASTSGIRADEDGVETYGDLQEYSWLRRQAIVITTNPDFELVIVAAIFANCVTLSLYKPTEPDDSPWNRKLFWADLALNIVYTVEMLLRILAAGAPWVLSYLNRPWNAFDASMVVIGYTVFIPTDSGNTSAIRALRALRALRPLRTITRFESLRGVVVCFMEAVPLLGAVACVLVMFLFLFAIAAVQMFTAVYHNVCMGPDPISNVMLTEVELKAIQGIQVDDPGMFGCTGGEEPSLSRFWDSLRSCPDNTTCVTTSYSTANTTAGWDNTAMAMLTDFQCLTLTSWGYVMYRTMDATSPFAAIYFVILIVFGAYFVLQLFLAVLKTKFAKAQSIFIAKQAQQAGKPRRKNTLVTFFSKAKSKFSEAVSKHSKQSMLRSQLHSVIRSQCSVRMSQSMRQIEPPAPEPAQDKTHADSTSTAAKAPLVSPALDPDQDTRPSPSGLIPAVHADEPSTSPIAGPTVDPHSATTGTDNGDKKVLFGAADSAPGPSAGHLEFKGGKQPLSQIKEDAGKEGPEADNSQRSHRSALKSALATGKGKADAAAGQQGASGWVGGKDRLNAVVAAGGAPQGLTETDLTSDAQVIAMLSIQEFDEIVADMPWWPRARLRLQFRLRKLAEQPMFDNFFLFIILISTILLAIEYDGMSDSLLAVLWDVNIALTVIFTIEVLIKLAGFGFWEYFKDGFNVFDMIIVTTSWVEIIIVTVAGSGALRSMRALRILLALRVLRLLKVFKYMAGLRKIAEVLVNSFASFFAIVVLLLLFWLVFTIMGLHVFGALTLPYPNGYPNFDTFLNAMVSTFNILNLENWNQQMYAVIDASNWGTTAYYLIWIIIGKYTLLALFLAVMLEAYEAKYDPTMQKGGGNGSRAGSVMSSFRSHNSSAHHSITRDSPANRDSPVAKAMVTKVKPHPPPPPPQPPGASPSPPPAEAHQKATDTATGRDPPDRPGGPVGEATEEAGRPAGASSSSVPRDSFPVRAPAAGSGVNPYMMPVVTHSRRASQVTAAPASPSPNDLLKATKNLLEAMEQGSSDRSSGGRKDARQRGSPSRLSRALDSEKTSMQYPRSRRGSTTSHVQSRRVSVEMARWLVELPEAEPPPDAAGVSQPVSPFVANQPGPQSFKDTPAEVSASAQPQAQPQWPTLVPKADGETHSAEASGSHAAPTSKHLSGSHAAAATSKHTSGTSNVLGLTEGGQEGAPNTEPLVTTLTSDVLKIHTRRTSVDLVQIPVVTAGDVADAAHESKASHGRPGEPRGPKQHSHPHAHQQSHLASVQAGYAHQSTQGTGRAAGQGGVLSKSTELLSTPGDYSLAAGRDTGSTWGNRSRKHLSAEDTVRARQRRRNGAIMIEGSGKSFWYFDEDHPVRVWVYDRITTKTYDYIMIGIIFLNCIQMALESPYVEPGSTLDLAIYYSDIGYTIIFGLEVLIKSFAFTFRAYIKNVPNQVDFAIVCISVLVLALQAITTNAQIATALRVLRAVKPLRLLTRSEGMRIVFKSVMLSMAAMANVSLVCIMFFLIFAILGTQLFMGLFWSCNDPDVSNVTDCTGDWVVDPSFNVTAPRVWANSYPNFDNVGNSLIVCFITATLNGYTSIMVQAMSAPQIKGDQPQMNSNPGAFFWFVGFVFVCAFTLLNLYVGVIFSQFSRIRLMSTTGSAFLTNSQQEWAELSKMIFKLKPGEKPQVPSNPICRFAHWLTDNNKWEVFMLTVSMVNIGCMASMHWDMPEAMIVKLDKANIFFVAVYTTDVVLKVLAQGWRTYWKDGWNKFDVFLVVTAIIDLIITTAQMNFIRVLRVLRTQKLLRFFRIAQNGRMGKAAQNVRSLFTTLVAALPAFGNVGSLIGLVLFMYAYVGVYLFGRLRWDVGINEHVNFRNFPNAILVLLRVATGDNWSNIFLDCIPQQDCESTDGHTCGTWAAIPYFLTFIIMVFVVLLNLFTAVIVETFEKIHEQDEWKLSPQALEEFAQLWSEYDDGSGTILPRHLEELLMKLDPPLGLGSMADSKDVLRFVYDLDIPLVNGRVPFHKTIFELVKRVSHSEIPEALREQLERTIEKFFNNLPDGDALNFSAAVSVGRVQRNWRARARAAKLKRKRQWRAQRDGAPNYSTLCEDREYLIEAYQLLKETERNIFTTNGGTGPFHSRWKFNPSFLPWAADFDRTGGFFERKTLKNIMTFNWRGNKVAAADRVTGRSRRPSSQGQIANEPQSPASMSLFARFRNSDLMRSFTDKDGFLGSLISPGPREGRPSNTGDNKTHRLSRSGSILSEGLSPRGGPGGNNSAVQPRRSSGVPIEQTDGPRRPSKMDPILEGPAQGGLGMQGGVGVALQHGAEPSVSSKRPGFLRASQGSVPDYVI